MGIFPIFFLFYLNFSLIWGIQTEPEISERVFGLDWVVDWAMDWVTKMKIIIKTTLGLATPVDLEVDPHEKIGVVKERAATAQVVEPGKAKLSHKNEILDENKTLKDYGIKDGDTLELLPDHMTGASLPPLSFLEFAYKQQKINQAFAKRVSYESKIIRSQRLPIIPKDPKHWVMTIRASKGKWRGRDYVVHVRLPDRYPFVPPKVEWKSPMSPKHPNIFPRTGWVCLNILERDWRSDYSLITIYKSLIWLLENPNYEHREVSYTNNSRGFFDFLWGRS